ncbi:hypothetical protein [Pseudogulbenkiania sp. MAI-1]|uniref:hypothetical protein n=1 Tax=Pseudogulbenkiania sp. MAI-1 TaxID=990370 RepID=UPI00045EB062|nr:hypothetical protein [Pseudogulbenkiania sp. MAI-1]
MAAPPGRPPGGTKPPGSGRKPGQKNSNVTAKLKADLWATYVKLGQRKYLLEFAKSAPEDFMRHLMKLIPAPAPEINVGVGVSVPNGTLTGPELRDAAARIAFTLAKAANEAGIDAAPPTRTIGAVPEPVAEVIDQLPPSTESEPLNNPPVGQTYAGSQAEQGRYGKFDKRTRTFDGDRHPAVKKRRDLL